MKTTLKILQLQDHTTETGLIGASFKQRGMDIETVMVDTKHTFTAALKNTVFDVILYHDRFPLTAGDALDILNKKNIKVPFIVIAAPGADAFPATLIKKGASDYILTNDLDSLPVAVHEAIEKFKEQKIKDNCLEELTAESTRHRAITTHSQEGVIILSAEGKPKYVSSSVKNILGYDQEEILQMDLISIAHPDDLLSLADVLSKALANPGTPVKGHTGRMLHKNGSWHWIEATITNMLHDPAVNGIVDNFRDVTEQKIADEKITHLNRLYAFISQINQSIVHSADHKQLFKEACRIAIQIGQFKAAWIGLFEVATKKINLVESAGILAEDLPKFTDVHYPDNGAQDCVLRTEHYYVCNDIQHDFPIKSWRSVALTSGYASMLVLPVRKLGVITGTFNLYASEIDFFTKEEISLLVEATGDISFALDLIAKQQKKLEADELIKRKELQLREAQAIAHMGSWERNFSTGNVEWSEEMLRIYGIPVSEYKQSRDSWISYIHPDDLEGVMLITDAAMAAKKNADFYHRIIRKDGVVRYIHSLTHIESDADNNPVRLHGVGYDVTEMKQAEIALRQSESNLQAIFENTSEGFILTDLNGYIKTFNQKAKEIWLLNSGKEIMPGKAIFDFVRESTKESYKAAIPKVLAGETLQYDILFERENGETAWFNFTVNGVQNSGRTEGFSITAIDITQRKKAEQQLQESEAFNKGVLASLSSHIAVIDHKGNIIAVNKAWDDFAKSNGVVSLEGVSTGSNYMEVCQRAMASGDITAAQTLQGLHAVISKEVKTFELEYPCHSLTEERWFNLSVMNFGEDDDKIVISHQNITRRKNTEQKLLRSEFKYRQIVETAQEGIWLIDEDDSTTFVNEKMCAIIGYSSEEMIGMKSVFFKDDEGLQLAKNNLLRTRQGITETYDSSFITKDGRLIWTQVSSNPIINEKGIYEGSLCMVSDITEKKKLEKLLNETNNMARVGSWEMDIVAETIFWSEVTRQILGVSNDVVPDMEKAVAFYKPGPSRDAITIALDDAMEKGTSFDLELQIFTPDNIERWVRTTGRSEITNGKCTRVFGSFQDIDKRKKAELEVLRIYEEKNIILESIGDGFFAVDTDWVVTYWNSQAEKMLKVPKAEIAGRNLWEVFSEGVESLSYIKCNEAVRNGEVTHFADYFASLEKWFAISVFPSDKGVSVYFKDITENKTTDIRFKKLNEELQQHARELAVSNKELEQFAYVASHDLQEPLRMITSFLAQIEKKYAALLDDKGKKYIHFAMDGAKRMRHIILDLLEFSRVGQTDDKLEIVDLNDLVGEILSLLRRQVEEKQAVIRVDKLPVIRTFKSPLRQVLQNLIGNSLVYHSGGTHEITVGVIELDLFWQLSVTDNGIGIAPEYYDKIFTIFQRLHNKEEYSGTGIGLAISKKIIESLGGKIWVESEEGKGSTFYFTLPK